jgi:hypothetical protein
MQTTGRGSDSDEVSPNCPDPIVRATLVAVHRRDHGHSDDTCRPHQIEVVRLGPAAMAVCHDCCFEYGFDDNHACEDVALQHRLATA